VSVCSPNHLHRAHIAAGLRLGCDVICEKPLVPTIADLEALRELERETGKRVYNVLQLRHHPAIIELRERVEAAPADHRFDVELTYITSRGRWYFESWKGDPRKSLGVATNIGIHFFDMLHVLFGDLRHSELHVSTEAKAGGVLAFERADVRWFLSIDADDLPAHVRGRRPTHRVITSTATPSSSPTASPTCTRSPTPRCSPGAGFGLEDARRCIATVEALRHAPVVPPRAEPA
jgi:UDP-N-acetyl-2-amino-2-deoxyglucuronate dehydrogenase